MKKRTTTLTKEELEQWFIDHPSQPSTNDDFCSIQFPVVKRVSVSTIGGGWEKSKKQQLKEDRINKLRKIKGKKPNVSLEKDLWVDGLIPVQPMSAPLGLSTYIDLKYSDQDE